MDMGTCDPNVMECEPDDPNEQPDNPSNPYAEPTGASFSYAAVPPGLYTGWTPSSCTSGGDDVDQDGVNSACELALAQAFAPGLRIAYEDDVWESSRGLLGGEYYWAVNQVYVSGEWRLRIAYLPAYYEDGGTVSGGFAAHDGDSEYIIEEVAYVSWTGNWELRRVFLSAHCGASNGVDCQWWAADRWDRYGSYWNGVRRGAPNVWVAEDKHANYYSRWKCGTGSFGVDVCARHDAIVRFPVHDGFNVGSGAVDLVGVVPGRRGSQFTRPGDAERIWKTSGKFYGWQLTRDGGATPYGEVLYNFGYGWPSGNHVCVPASDRYCSPNASIASHATGGPFGGFQSRPGTGYQTRIVVQLRHTASAVTVTALDPDYSENWAIAYDAAGNELTRARFAYDGVPGSFTASTVTLSASGIARLDLMNDARDYVAFDRVYTTTPYATGGPFGGFQSTPGTGAQSTITLRFTHPQSSVEVRALDPDYSQNWLVAYDAWGWEITRAQFPYDSTPWYDNVGTARVAASNIYRADLVPDPADYVAYDRVRLSEAASAPEPQPDPEPEPDPGGCVDARFCEEY